MGKEMMRKTTKTRNRKGNRMEKSKEREDEEE